MLGLVLRWSRFCQESSGSRAIANRQLLPCQGFCFAHLARQKSPIPGMKSQSISLEARVWPSKADPMAVKLMKRI